MNSELDYWLEKLRHERWTLHVGGRDKRHPDWLAAHFTWHDCADVIIIRGEASAVAFRTPTDDTTDVLAPEYVTWLYGDDTSAVWALRAVLSLPRPGSLHEPRQLIPAPESCHIPLEGRKPVTIRPLR